MFFSRLARQTQKNLSYKSKAQYFFSKKDVFVDVNKEKMRISEVSPYVLGGCVGISWIFIIYYWYTSEDRMRIKAQIYMEENAKLPQFKSADAEKPEEYRQEYIDKQKRKYKQLVNSRKRDEEQQKQLYDDYQKFVATDKEDN